MRVEKINDDQESPRLADPCYISLFKLRSDYEELRYYRGIANIISPLSQYSTTCTVIRKIEFATYIPTTELRRVYLCIHWYTLLIEIAETIVCSILGEEKGRSCLESALQKMTEGIGANGYLFLIILTMCRSY